MTDSEIYYRPLPLLSGGRWRLAGGPVGFSQFELLRRGAAPELSDAAPDYVIRALTAPRADILGLSMDRPRIMGIVNATPDSFSDGGSYDPAAHAAAQIAAGAEMLDIGGESTRPGAQEIPPAEEVARILPVIAAAGPVPVSADTRKAAVADAALKAGAGMVNDVSGFDFDPGMPGMVAHHAAPVCLMHAQGLPADMQDDPRYDDVLLDVYDALAARIARAEAAGITRDRIIVDPGIGFGKTLEHNLAILRRISLYHGLGCAILLGVSRKAFIGTIGGARTAAERGPGTLALTLAAIAQGIQIHRVHDVAEITQGIRLWQVLSEGSGK
ncbi:Dihydropteroate synthase [Paracoccus alcaliphilus]|uniref:Dihydropteroate synthase n=1 Tax=Paracoccus alcaliphilus TaxID=34002 RepID=A0A1H8KN50_9RHOB|nr:dihydropteroate synthase [Paracoccus alcaliphilus]WCR17324.1 dihydropteroate synthase [Paracoccus alcaliphilus]SEN94026.1 Dihydropteroate synthase [Paracoccus alcaliphilus]